MGDLRGHDLQGGDQRIIRLRRDDLRAQAERIVPRRSEGTPTQLVQIYDGGAMPSSPDWGIRYKPRGPKPRAARGRRRPTLRMRSSSMCLGARHRSAIS
jgi:hypothetical protein